MPIDGGIVSLLTEARGDRLDQDAYQADFGERLWLADGFDSWKLERMQDFMETGFASWEAFIAGDWDRSLALYQSQRTGLRKLAEQSAAHRSFFHRVRIAEEPPSPYLQWEMHCLLLRAQCWERIRVVDAAAVASYETESPLPEMISLCGRTLYRVLYTAHGTPDGAIRYTDQGVISRYEDFAKTLYRSGEDIASYFHRKIARLPPPNV